jgi:hypothetical protein
MTWKQPFDSETLATLRVIFDEACGVTPANKRKSELLSDLTMLILGRAAQSGLSSSELRQYALSKAADLVAERPAG